MNRILRSLLFIALLSAGLATTRAADTAPKSVIHIVTVAWKKDTTPAQIKAAIDGAHKLPAEYKGITRVWTNALKIQNAEGAKVPKNAVIVMEFVDQKALEAYTDSPAQLKWYEAYRPIREVSTTFDVTN